MKRRRTYDSKKEAEKHYCQAKSRRQVEAGSWAESRRGCGNVAKTQLDDGHWVCGVHKDPAKRYGWN